MTFTAPEVQQRFMAIEAQIRDAGGDGVSPAAVRDSNATMTTRVRCEADMALSIHVAFSQRRSPLASGGEPDRSVPVGRSARAVATRVCGRRALVHWKGTPFSG